MVDNTKTSQKEEHLIEGLARVLAEEFWTLHYKTETGTISYVVNDTWEGFKGGAIAMINDLRSKGIEI